MYIRDHNCITNYINCVRTGIYVEREMNQINKLFPIVLWNSITVIVKYSTARYCVQIMTGCTVCDRLHFNREYVYATYNNNITHDNNLDKRRQEFCTDRQTLRSNRLKQHKIQHKLGANSVVIIK